ncbi:MAG: V-type ATP synthase subunit E family protein [Oscillospiraceae bacterium]|nr:V-type ATP synthase subunit E family protein [Oscillospiraceae bacterium]
MSVEEEKLARFRQAIFAEAEAQSAAILSEAGEYQSEKLKAASDEALEESFRRIRSRADEYRADMARRLTRERLASRHRLLRRRDELTDALFDEAADRLLSWSETPDYEALMERLLQQCGALLEGGELLIRERDKALFERLAPGVSLTADPMNRLGGFALRNQKQGRYLDETLAARLEQSRERFYETVSLTAAPAGGERSEVC